jgi:hypothetical protein
MENNTNDLQKDINAFIENVSEQVKSFDIELSVFIRMLRKKSKGQVAMTLSDEIKEYLDDMGTEVFAMDSTHLLYSECLEGWKQNPSSSGSKLLKRIDWSEKTGILPIKALGVSKEGMIRFAAHGGSLDIRYMTFHDLKQCIPVNFANNKVDVWRESIKSLDSSIKGKKSQNENKEFSIDNSSSLSGLVFANDDIKNKILNKQTPVEE